MGSTRAGSAFVSRTALGVRVDRGAQAVRILRDAVADADDELLEDLWSRLRPQTVQVYQETLAAARAAAAGTAAARDEQPASIDGGRLTRDSIAVVYINT